MLLMQFLSREGHLTSICCSQGACRGQSYRHLHGIRNFVCSVLIVIQLIIKWEPQLLQLGTASHRWKKKKKRVPHQGQQSDIDAVAEWFPH